MYVINTVSGLFIKRLSINPNGGVVLISDNKIYDTITMPAEEVTIVCKVVSSRLFRKNLIIQKAGYEYGCNC